MAFDRTATVLIAEPNSNAKRNDASRKAVARAVIGVADSTGGLVLKSVGGKLMLLFSTPDAAASAASKMHAAVDALPASGGSKLGVQIGFHTGPAAPAARGLADDTVKLVLRLVEQAQDGQTITSQQTAERLNPAFRGFSRSIRPMQAASDQVRLCEVASWHQKGVRPPGWSAMAVFRLTYGEQLAVCSREKDVVVIGRDEECDLLVDSRVTSRQHCTLRYRDGQVTLRDHSSNGTYVTVDEREFLVKEHDARLPDQARIAIGEPRANGAEVVEFCYALIT
jgi:hypothetical protein